jgi:hypothetical protein
MPGESPKTSSERPSQIEDVKDEASQRMPALDLETLIQVQYFLREVLENDGKGSINGKECMWDEQQLVDLCSSLANLHCTSKRGLFPRSLSSVVHEASDPLFTALASLPNQPSLRYRGFHGPIRPLKATL